MPRGVYLHTATGRREEFQCAPGPAGWRYVSPGVDLTVDSRWRPARLELRSDGWTLRGGGAGRELLWVRTPSEGAEEGREHAADALGFLGGSPAFLVALARSLRVSGLGVGETADVPLVEVTGAALAARRVVRRLTLVSVEEHPTETDPLPVETWTSLDPETAVDTEFCVAGDVLLAAEGVELDVLESPPNLG